MFRCGLTFLLLMTVLTGTAQANPSPAEIARMEALEPQQRWDSPQWQRERALIVDTRSACQARWDMLWRWAKRGNLEARHLLLESESGALPLFTRTPLSADNANDQLWLRVFLAIHQLGYVGSSAASADTARQALDHIGTWKHKGTAAFTACYNTSPDTDCTAIAIEQGMVPTFKAYADQIDARIAAGAQPVCTP